MTIGRFNKKTNISSIYVDIIVRLYESNEGMEVHELSHVMSQCAYAP